MYVENAAEAHLLAADALTPGAPAGRPRLFHQPGRTLELLAVDRRPVGLGRAAADQGVDVAAGGLGAWRGPGMALSPVSPAWRAAHDAVSGGPTGPLPLLRHRRARRDFGYQPRISTAEGMSRLAASWQQEGGPLPVHGSD